MYGPLLPRVVTRGRSARSVGCFCAGSSPRAGRLGQSMPCMMIGVPPHIVVDVVVRSALGFLGRADAVAAAPRTRTAKARVTILDNGTLMLVQISTSYWHPLLARVGRKAFFSVYFSGDGSGAFNI